MPPAPAQSQFKLSALRRKKELLCRIYMWGFVSIMLVLLFMLLPRTTDAHRSVPVDLAAARHTTPQPGAQKEDALLISVTRDGNVFFRDRRVLPSELASEIRERVRYGAEKKAYLKVAARAMYGGAILVLDRVRLAGVEKVGFLTGQSSQ
jgi:biopolymer transport protein ExbD